MNRLVSSCLLPVLFAAAPLAASHTADSDLAGLLAGSDVVVLGTVHAVHTTRLDGELVTIATVTVEESLLGEPEPSLEVVVPGGFDLDRRVPIATVVSGQTQLASGERLILFLVRIGDGRYALTLADTGALTVSPDTGAPLVDTTPPLPLDELRNLLSRLDAGR
jgi:hypothetical protein